MNNKLNLINEYGFDRAYLNEVLQYFECSLNFNLEARNSLYKGDYWKLEAGKPEIEIDLIFNVNAMYDSENDPKEEFYFNYGYRHCGNLLTISGAKDRVIEMHVAISQLPFIEQISSNEY